MNDRVKVGIDYKLHRFLRAMPLPTNEAHFTWNGTWLPLSAATLVRGDAARAAAAHALHRLAGAHDLERNPSVASLQLADVREYLPNDILSKVDRATMAHGLESRAPLLNTAVAELAIALPDRLRVNGSRTKVLLRRLCERHFGRAHADAPKQGFSLPIHRWLRTDGRTLVRALLSRERVDAVGVLDPDRVKAVTDAHLSGRAMYGWELWGLMVLVAWHEQRVASVPALPDASDVREMAFTYS
jgi:asparagine synthase (glutamine-hydrolysing)